LKVILRIRFDAEMARARERKAVQDWEAAWAAPERAHVLSQSEAWPHTWVHWEMFKFGLARGDAQEVFGQIPRLLLAAPGSLTGRAPRGNTGRTNVGIFQPMPIPADLLRDLDEQG
jgi:hypothetical protein